MTWVVELVETTPASVVELVETNIPNSMNIARQAERQQS